MDRGTAPTDAQAAERAAQHQTLFRSINEHIHELNAAFGALTETRVVVCECGAIDCVELIELDEPTYERARSDPTQLLMIPGHDIPGLDHVVERHETFCLTRKPDSSG